MKDVDEAYESLKKNGQNTVDNLVKWMKDAKVLEMVKKTEDEAKLMFDDVEDKTNITLEKFKAVLMSMSAVSQTGIRDIMLILASYTDGHANILTKNLERISDPNTSLLGTFSESNKKNKPQTTKKNKRNKDG